jgi:hypothetical protein
VRSTTMPPTCIHGMVLKTSNYNLMSLYDDDMMFQSARDCW